MKRYLPITILVVTLTLVVGGIVAYRHYYLPKYRWDLNFSRKSTEPYGLRFFYEAFKAQDREVVLLEQEGEQGLPVRNRFDSAGVRANFVSVSGYFSHDTAFEGSLLRFVNRGGRAFIGTAYIPGSFLNKFLPDGKRVRNSNFLYRKQVKLSFLSDSLVDERATVFHHQFLKDTTQVIWYGYNLSYFQDTLAQFGFEPLATLNDSLVTMFAIRHGAGRFIVYTSPLTLTNYHFITEKGYTHASQILGLLHKGPTFWDEPVVYTMESHKQKHLNPLRFLFTSPSLLWAWYLLLTSILLYVAFRSKREQRIIPLVPQNHSSSIDFAKTVGTLYFKHDDRSQIAEEMYAQFLADLRTRYHLSTDVPDSELVASVSCHSGIAQNLVQGLFTDFSHARQRAMASGEDLVNLYRALERFNYRKK